MTCECREEWLAKTDEPRPDDDPNRCDDWPNCTENDDD